MKRSVTLILLALIVCRGSLSFGQAPTTQTPTTQTSDQFIIGLSSAGVTSLRYIKDELKTDYIQYGRSLGPLLVSYRQGDEPWKTARTTELSLRIGADLEL